MREGEEGQGDEGGGGGPYNAGDEREGEEGILPAFVLITHDEKSRVKSYPK